MNKVGALLFWLQFVVFAASLLALLLFGDVLHENGLRKATFVVLYMSGLPAVCTVVGLLVVSEKETEAVDKEDDGSPPKVP